MRGVAFSVTLLLSLCINAMVFAGDMQKVDLPPIDPPDHWHDLTYDDATSTSKCIGDPETPLCAVETVLACFMRAKVELCRIGSGDKNYPAMITTETQPALAQRYWVADVDIVTVKNKSSFAKVRYLKPKIDDIAIKIHKVDCYFGKCPKPVGPPAIYLVRKNGDKWMAADWATPRW